MAYELAKSDKKRTPQLASTLSKLLKYETSINIAEMLEDEQLEKIGSDVEREYKIDKKSRSDWEESAERAMDIALQVRKPKNYPFENAANIKYPLVTVAALQFGARAYPAIIDGNRVVKAQVLGRDDGIPADQQPQQGMPGQGMPQGMGPEQGMPPGMPGPEQGMPQGQPEMPQEMHQMPDGTWMTSDGKLWKVPPGAKRAKADRVSQHMSYQLLCEMEEWEEDTDVLLHHLPIVGCAFRKIWRSMELGRNKAEMVPAVHLVVNNKVRTLDEAPRVTHELFLYPQDIEERKLSGTFLDIELPAPTSSAEIDGDDDDAPHCFLEQHRFLDLDGDGYREPYIVTVHKDDCKVVRIVANYRVEDIKDDGKRITRIPKDQYFVKYSFIPDPKGGFYDIGFGRLLESLGETIDTTINQMLDAGHLQNAGGGFIGSGIRLKKNDIKVRPGRYEQIATNGDLRAQIYNHQFPGPSPVLFNLLGMMVEAARDITAVKDILTGDTGDKGVQTATTTLAMIEQGLKVFTAIYKRVYRAMQDEFKLLFKLNAQYMEDQEYFTFLDQQQAVAKEDYDMASMDIVPVADPKMVTDMQRTGRANIYMQVSASPMAATTDAQELARRFWNAIGEDEPEKLIAKQAPPPPDYVAKVKKDESAAELNMAKAEKTKVETEIMPKEAEHDGLQKEADLTLRAEDQQHRQTMDKAKLEMDAVGMSHDMNQEKRQQELDATFGAAELQQKAAADERNFEMAKNKAKSDA